MSAKELTLYRVIMKNVGTFSVWPVNHGLPPEWQAEGTQGSREYCATRIRELSATLTSHPPTSQDKKVPH